MAKSRAATSRVPWRTTLASVVGILIALWGSVQASPSEIRPGGDRDLNERSVNDKYRFSRIERCFLKKINRRRLDRGLTRLWWDKQIGYVARRHAIRMASLRRVEHDDHLGSRLTRWRALGQNSGSGRGCGVLWRAFWRSDGHRANVLGNWRFIGVGARRGPRGRLYVQQVFEYRSNPGNIYGWP